jgi:hypothetical protein
MTARDDRAAAFEETVSAAGRVLAAELAAAGDRAARRAAWARYGDAQDTAGDAFRAAQAAERGETPSALAQCAGCGVFHSSGPAHLCVVYDGPPCRTCGEPTVCYQVGAPGYGSGRTCPAGHHEEITPHGILTPGDVR